MLNWISMDLPRERSVESAEWDLWDADSAAARRLSNNADDIDQAEPHRAMQGVLVGALLGGALWLLIGLAIYWML